MQKYMLVIADCTKMNEAKFLFLSSLAHSYFKNGWPNWKVYKMGTDQVIRGFVWVELPVTHSEGSGIR